jgi:hypothetical protein
LFKQAKSVYFDFYKELNLWHKDLVKNKKMEKTKAIVAGGTKLARIMFSLIKNKEFYDSKKILNREEIIDNSATEGSMSVVAYEGSGGEPRKKISLKA